MPRIAARRWLGPALVLAAAAAAVGLVGRTAGQQRGKPAPPLDGGVAWLNTAGPIKLADLKGKVVVLDFWTFCCINCIHTLPDLAKLEKKYEKELVVIGVHSAKFDTEKVTENIRKAILRYQIAHPVVNDAEHRIWDAYGITSWPSLVVIDPEGNYLGEANGEGNFDLLDTVIGKLIKEHTAKGTLSLKPLHFDAEKFRDKPSPLAFPGKVLAASNRLFISDSTHHRIVVTDLNGNKIAVAGTGEAGKVDGPFATAQFNDPQGLALDGETLYVADRKNHSIRALDLKAGTVRTAAGTGKQDRENRFSGGPALRTGLNSPWDLLRIGRTIYVAMAGHHQIWTFDLDKNRVEPYAGDGRENIRDGSLNQAEFAQPSGLTTDGHSLFVADSEVSGVRQVGLNGSDEVKTLVGRGLFIFGDEDGVGTAVRLQHALGVVAVNGKLYVADTYNSKLKVLDPATRECKTFLGGDGLFNEPAGISAAGGKLYVADTNANRIRVVDLATKAVSTLELKGVEPVGKDH
ncbi:MAG TPA: thioredoxin-like domain-containing protein [Gemmataceae bacterium]|nr:thioredoxin-like domain-containing protein [Gemmataceae bacterium]